MKKLFLAVLFVLTTAGTAMAQSIADIPREKTLILENIDGGVAVPENMNPYGGQYLDWGMWQANAESLFYYNLETSKLEPWLAESGEYSADAMSATIKLRKGTKWSDGVPFTADDVVFTIEMLKANPNLRWSVLVSEWVKTITAVDAQTVKIEFFKPNPRFLLDFFGVRIWETLLISPKHVWEKVDPNTFANFDLERGLPLGTGPYKLVRSTGTETVWDRLPSWWGAETGFMDMPEPERMIWLAAPTEDTRAAMAVGDQLDAMWVMSRSTFEIARQRNPNIIGWSRDLPYAYLDACPRELLINNALPPFDKRVIRHAINDAIDRQQLVDAAYEGMTEPSYSLFPTYAPLKAFLDRNAATLELVRSKPEEIAPALEKEGYKLNGDGVWADASGKPLKVEITLRSGEADQVKMAPVVVAQLRKAGFDASSRLMETSVFYTEARAGRLSLYLDSVCGSVSDPYASFYEFTSRNIKPIGEDAENETRFSNARLNELIDIMSATSPDTDKFMAAADEAQRIFSEELPIIPLVQARLLTPFNTTYWTNWPTADNPYVHPGHWWVTGNYLIHNVKAVKH